MSVQAWPFLVTRNRSLDYRTVVAPDFIVDANISGILANETSSELAEVPRCRQFANTKAGSITLLYHAVGAMHEGEPYKDPFGRRITWIEGIVLKGLHENIPDSKALVQEAHSHVNNQFLKFWDTADIKPPVHRSTPFDTNIPEAVPIAVETARKTESRQERAVKPVNGSLQFVSGAVAAVVVMAVAISFLVLGGVLGIELFPDDENAIVTPMVTVTVSPEPNATETVTPSETGEYDEMQPEKTSIPTEETESNSITPEPTRNPSTGDVKDPS